METVRFPFFFVGGRQIKECVGAVFDAMMLKMRNLNMPQNFLPDTIDQKVRKSILTSKNHERCSR